MKKLDEVVSSVVKDLVQSNELFTALDVSNKVKVTLPFARHREVRDLVRSLFSTEIETAGWSRTPISVKLVDGSVAEALLYHPIADAWDLDVKYDVQKREQSTAKVVNQPLPASVASDGTVTVTPSVVPVVSSPSVTQTVAPVSSSPVVSQTLAQMQAKDLWAQMFQSQPSLFPRKP